MQSPIEGAQVLTFDIDWAPDFIIDWLANLLVEKSTPATWFATHPSPAVDNLLSEPLFEVGIHPNFLPHSSQGEDVETVLDYCFDLVPGAKSVRLHSLLQSTPILSAIMARGQIRNDVSLFMPNYPYLAPFEYTWQGEKILRFPYFWEDDMIMEQENYHWSYVQHDEEIASSGILIYDFHPVHVYLNSSEPSSYNLLKQRVGDLKEASPPDSEGLINPEAGTKSFLLEMLEQTSRVYRDRLDSISSNLPGTPS